MPPDTTTSHAAQVPAIPDVLDPAAKLSALRRIVAESQCAKLAWRDPRTGKKHRALVDVATARAILLVADALDEQGLAKHATLLRFLEKPIPVVASIAWKLCKFG